MKKSVMLTGAPVTGKSTVTRSLRGESGFTPFPDYTTRQIRPDEIDGVDKTFVSREAFVELHNTGRIIEPSLEYCNYQGNYYGSPTEWLSAQELGEQKVITCVAVKIAGLIRRANPDLIWVHLEADDTERAQRLALRGITHAEVTRRMVNAGGDSLIRPAGSDLIINTSQVPLDATVEIILGATE